MLKFFRTLRKKLIEQDNVRKPASPALRFKAAGDKAAGRYLVYAIGEIALVMIGILIAENLAPTLKGGFSIFEL